MGKEYFKDPKAFIEYSNSMKDDYPNIDKYNLGENYKILIVFDDRMAYMISNKTAWTNSYWLLIVIEN